MDVYRSDGSKALQQICTYQFWKVDPPPEVIEEPQEVQEVQEKKPVPEFVQEKKEEEIAAEEEEENKEEPESSSKNFKTKFNFFQIFGITLRFYFLEKKEEKTEEEIAAEEEKRRKFEELRARG